MTNREIAETYQDCYMEFVAETGMLVMGNEKLERRILVENGNLRSIDLREKATGELWAAGEEYWQRCPLFLPDEPVTAAFSACAVPEAWRVAGHLKGVLTLETKFATVTYTYTIFPGQPFVSVKATVEAKTAVTAAEQTEHTPLLNGVEGSYAASTGKRFCGEDTIDCVGLRNAHLTLERIALLDKTDQNDFLVERTTTPLYRRWNKKINGDLFLFTDSVSGASLLIVKDAPTASSQLNRSAPDLTIYGNDAAALGGTGVDFSALPPGLIPLYGCTMGVGRAETMFKLYRAFERKLWLGDPGGRLFIMSNTWGDRSQDSAICENFLLEEISRGAELGVDILQIDDGWMQGVTANSRRKKQGVWEGFYHDDPDFWRVNAERFPNGLETVVEAARGKGMEVGLWFGPDSSHEFENYKRDVETIWQFYQRYGIRYYKLDGVKIRSKLCEMRFYEFMDSLIERSDGEIRFNLDVTAEDRFGYLLHPRFGTLFLENRYTDWGNYFPHNTLKNLWCLSGVIPTRRLQIEFLNNRRNKEQYTGLLFAPVDYGMDYLFAVTMTANPLVWMEMTGLAQEDAATLKGIISVYKPHAAALFDADISPIGACPNGMGFTGFHCENTPESGYLLLFRETTPHATEQYCIPGLPQNAIFEVLYASSGCAITGEPKGISVTLDRPRSVAFIRYSSFA